MNDIEYERMYRAEGLHWWYVSLHELILRHVCREAEKRGRLSILDAGCGTGRLMELMAPFGAVAGCDRSPLALRFCSQRGLEYTFSADLNHADLGRDRYDLITSIDVLYHLAVQDELAILDRFRAALRPGGCLILNLVAFESLRSTHDIAVHTRRRYRRSDVLQLLGLAGFQVERLSYRPCLPFPAVAAYRALSRFTTDTSKPERVASDVEVPHPLLNRVMLAVCRGENALIARGARLPFGTSVFAVARRPAETPANRNTP